MARNPITNAKADIQKAKAQIKRLEATVEVARRNGRQALLKGFELGMKQTELATLWGTSQTRMKENLNRAKAEREGTI